MPQVDSALTAMYDWHLVVLSIVIAVLTSYTALDLAGRVTAARDRLYQAWLFGGAVTMGVGIWSMHFIGMQAVSLPISVAYHAPTVLVSMLVAMVASGAAIFVASQPVMGLRQWVFGGMFMGLGTAAMHYIGMEAMRMPATMHYAPFLVALSVAIAIGGALIALRLVFRVREKLGLDWSWDKIGGAFIMGSAIAGMHYTAMGAVDFVPFAGAATKLKEGVGTSWLGPVALAVATFLVLILALLTSMIDRRFAEALQQSEGRLRSLYETGQAVVTNLELKPLLQTVTDTARTLLNARMCGLLVFGEKSEGYEYCTVSGGDYNLDALLEKTGFFRDPSQEGTCLRVDNISSSQDSLVKNRQEPPSLKAFLCVPLRVKGRTLGTLFIGKGPQDHDFTKDDEDLLLAFANDAAIGLENARLYERQKQDVVRLQELSHELDKAQESRLLTEDRNRIAHELHDQVAQVLFTIGLKANWCLEQLTSDTDIEQAVCIIKRLASESSLHIRNAIYGLSSPGIGEEQSLKNSLQNLIWELKESTGIDSDLMVAGELSHSPPKVEEALCKVTKEALANVAKHSRARVAVVSLRSSPQDITLTVQDDGIGLPSPIKETYCDSVNHFGLKGMRQRIEELGGKFHLGNGDEGGLIVTATVPFMRVRHEKDSAIDR